MPIKALLLALFVAWLPAAALAAPKIVVLGDSLSAGYGLPPGASFPEKLQAALTQDGVEAEIVGAGVSGDTSTGGLARLDWSVGDDADAVILELGANDALRGIPPARTRENLENIVTRLTKRGDAVLVAGMLAPPNMGNDYQQEFDAIFPDLAKRDGVDIYPFFLDGVAAEPSLNLPDGIHPNEKGIDEIVRRILPAVKALIAQVDAKAAG